MPQQARGTNSTVTILTLLVLGVGLSWTYFRIPDSITSHYLPVLENARVLISDNSLVAQSGLASMVQKLIGTKHMSVDEYIAFEGPIARDGVRIKLALGIVHVITLDSTTRFSLTLVPMAKRCLVHWLVFSHPVQHKSNQYTSTARCCCCKS